LLIKAGADPDIGQGGVPKDKNLKNWKKKKERKKIRLPVNIGIILSSSQDIAN